MVDLHIWMYGILCVFVVSFIVFFYRSIQLVNFDSQFALSVGLSVRWVEAFFFCLLVLAVTVAIRGVGVVLLSGMLIAPSLAAVIYPGWEVVRNLCNILFIVALIAIGLGTLFRIDSYQYKHTLVDLVIAVLLVNFSLVIAQVVLGVADTIQSQFLPNNVEVIRSLARDLMLNYNALWSGTTFSDSGYFALTVKNLFTVALAIGAFFTFAAIAAFLVIVS